MGGPFEPPGRLRVKLFGCGKTFSWIYRYTQNEDTHKIITIYTSY